MKKAEKKLQNRSVKEMDVTLNGAPKRVAPEYYVAALLQEMNLSQQVPVSINGERVPYEEYISRILLEGDRIEIERPKSGS